MYMHVWLSLEDSDYICFCISSANHGVWHIEALNIHLIQQTIVESSIYDVETLQILADT